MGYYLTTPEPRKRMAGIFSVSPKTHTPWSQVEKRGSRYYSPELGRWMSRDPIGEKGGRNLYCSMANDLLGRVDPDGRAPVAGGSCSPCDPCRFAFFISDNGSDGDHVKTKTIFSFGYPKGTCWFLRELWQVCTWLFDDFGSGDSRRGWRARVSGIDDLFPNPDNTVGGNTLQIRAKKEYLSCEADANGKGRWVSKTSTDAFGTLYRKNNMSPWVFSSNQNGISQ